MTDEPRDNSPIYGASIIISVVAIVVSLLGILHSLIGVLR